MAATAAVAMHLTSRGRVREAITKNKNRGVSAVRYIGYNDETTFIVNPWTEYPLNWRVFTSQAYCLINDAIQSCSIDQPNLSTFAQQTLSI